MKKTIRLCVLLAFIATTQLVFAQNNSEQAKTYFSTTLDSKSFLELCQKSLPTLEECKLVFKGQNADTYFGLIEDMKRSLTEELKKPTEPFVDLKVESFTTEDILADKGNYAGGMKNIVDKLQPSVTFYEIEMLREKGAENGMAYKYWVYLNGKWIMFPKPWRAFAK